MLLCHSFNGLRNLEAKVPFSGFSASRGIKIICRFMQTCKRDEKIDLKMSV